MNLFLHLIERKSAKSINLKYYYTGRPCTYGHYSQRWTNSGKCISCHYLKNPIAPKTSKDERRRMAKKRANRWYKENRELTIKRAAEWKKKNKDAVRISSRKSNKKPRHKAIRFMRDSIRRLLISKNGRTENILGYSRLDLVSHIDKQFTKGMSWGNYGEWHIDHIIPVSHFLSKGETDPKVINCLTNLRPMWAKDNLKKGDRVENLL